jgi:hypothetical protein
VSVVRAQSLTCASANASSPASVVSPIWLLMCQYSGAKQRSAEQRPVNEIRSTLEEARRREIADREFRNDMRGMLFLLKGSSSINPLGARVNDPRNPKNCHPTGHRLVSNLNPCPTIHPSENG